MKNLKLYESLGTMYSVGWPREDGTEMIHVFAQANPGDPFVPSNGHGASHWPCTVCEAHDYTEEMFHEQLNIIISEQRFLLDKLFI